LKHVSPEGLDRLEPLLESLRALAGRNDPVRAKVGASPSERNQAKRKREKILKEKKRGVFYLGSRAFLHFHEDPAGLFADVRLAGDEFERFDVTSGGDQRKLVARIRDVLPRLVVVLLISLAALAVAPAGHARCLQYEPASATLTGTLSSKLVPGPPGYTSLARGDQPETIWILTLDAPICVSGDRRHPKSHSDITEVQLILGSTAARALVTKPVRAVGTLSASKTGHHRTPVVLTVKQLRAT
jgi:hypothetical protein